uniref:Sperm-specific protein PHI-2B/PHI-3-like n=7 Tax=Saccoglossus kowalevskii TaxID=10224 RepID=A0ABM0GM48_SACKO
MVESTSNKSVKKTKVVASHPKTMDMIVEAIQALKDRKGTSVQAIKSYILTHHSTVSPAHITSSLRRAIKSGIESGLLVRPKDSNANGVNGRLRIGKLPEKPKKKAVTKKAVPKKTSTKKPTLKDKKPKDKKVTKKPKSDKKVTKKPKSDKKPQAKNTATKKSEKTTTKKPAQKKTPKKASKPKKPTTKKHTTKKLFTT